MMITLAYHIISWSWLICVGYWVVNAFRQKRVAERQNWAASLKYKVPTLVGAILLWHPKYFGPFTPVNEITILVGAIICVAGLGVAIWARRTLAGNWSSNVTFKQGHELIKSGPYRYARHPIYTGLLLMALGTALAVGRLGSWLGVGLFFIGFWIKLKVEEEVMVRHFPDQYPGYRQEVKAIVPFVL